MATTVLDSSNLDAIIADATGQKAPDKPVEAAAEAKGDEKIPDAIEDEAEDENGLTAGQREGLTKKMQAAIGKKHRALKEAEEFAADQYNQRRLAEQRAEQLERERKAQPAPAAEVEKPPVRENFQSDEEFRKAEVKWEVKQELAAERAKAVEEQRQQLAAQCENSIARATELVPDFVQTIEGTDTIIPAQVQNLVQHSPLFAELLYHFAQNPDDMARLGILPQAKLTVEFRKIEGKIQPFGPTPKVDPKVPNGKDDSPTPSPNGSTPSTETAPAPSKPRVAAPIKPLNAGSNSQVEKPASDRSYDEERAAWQRKNGVSFSRRQRH